MGRVESFVKGFREKHRCMEQRSCLYYRGLHIRPDCVAFTQRKEMKAWHRFKCIPCLAHISGTLLVFVFRFVLIVQPYTHDSCSGFLNASSLLNILHPFHQ